MIFDARLELGPFLNKLWTLFIKKKEISIETSAPVEEEGPMEKDIGIPTSDEVESVGKKIQKALGMDKKDEDEEEQIEEAEEGVFEED